MMEGSAKLDHILMKCIQAVEKKGWTIDDCLNHYPNVRSDLEPMLEAVLRLRRAHSMQSSPRFKREAMSRLQLRLQASKRPPQLYQRVTPTGKKGPFMLGKERRRYRLQWAVPLLVVAFSLAILTGGISFAADAAKPGEALYNLDRAFERIQVQLERNPYDVARLHLKFASERLAEATDLIQKGDSSNANSAIGGYKEEIDSAAPLLLEAYASGGDTEPLIQSANETLSIHESQLEQLLEMAPTEAKGAIESSLTEVHSIRVAVATPKPVAAPTIKDTPTPKFIKSTPILWATKTPISTVIPSADDTPHATSTPVRTPTPALPVTITPTPFIDPTIQVTTTPTRTTSPTPTPSKTPYQKVTETIAID